MVPLVALFFSVVRLNEVLYDPAGPDAGHEFIELLNADEASADLAVLRLVFVNGADGASRVVWEGSPTTLSPGERFVLGESEVTVADETRSLGLQNGPDALQLWRGSTRLDAVAWGGAPEHGEGAPAADATSTSLGRFPDGVDRDDNATDWRPLSIPSPGRPNSFANAWQLSVETMDPIWSPVAGWVEFTVVAVAIGTSGQQSTQVSWLPPTLRVDPVTVVGASGDSVVIARRAYLPPGPHDVVLTTDHESQPDTLRIPYQVGAAAWSLSEFLPAPRVGESEWIELRSTMSSPPELAGWTLADANRSPRAIEPPELTSGTGLVVAQDADGVARRYGLDRARVTQLVGGWNSLNNTADVIELRDPRGAVVDRVVYDDPLWGEAGVSLERGLSVADQWFPADPPTPGHPNRAEGAIVPREPGVSVAPDPFTPNDDGENDVLHIVLRSDAWRDASASVVDLRGETVRTLGPAPDTETRQWIWNGRDERGRPVPLGAYVVIIQASHEREVRSWRRLVALAR